MSIYVDIDTELSTITVACWKHCHLHSPRFGPQKQFVRLHRSNCLTVLDNVEAWPWPSVPATKRVGFFLGSTHPMF